MESGRSFAPAARFLASNFTTLANVVVEPTLMPHGSKSREHMVCHVKDTISDI